MTPLDERVAGLIRADGPIGFDRLVDLALYDADHGFYAAGGGAGRGRDFLTSPEVGPLFGAVVAAALDAWWTAMGRPEPFTVVEAGAGPGTLARAVRRAGPECLAAADHVLVERSAALRGSHPDGVRSVGSLAEVTDAPVVGVVLANELLDNLPFRLAERTDDGWSEVLVDLTPDGTPHLRSGVHGSRRPSPANARTMEGVGRLAPDAAVGAVVPVQEAAAAWLGEALDLLERGRVVVLDYADTTASMARRLVHPSFRPPDLAPTRDMEGPERVGEGWLRTYSGHQRGGSPLVALGTQDITTEVAVDQLVAVRGPDEDRAQVDFLRAHGLDELVEEGRRTWAERAHIGDLAAIAARSRITEAEALADPEGLGAFRVLEWAV